MGGNKKGGARVTKIATLILVSLLTTMDVTPTIGYALDKLDEQGTEITNIKEDGDILHIETGRIEDSINDTHIEDISLEDDNSEYYSNQETTLPKEEEELSNNSGDKMVNDKEYTPKVGKKNMAMTTKEVHQYTLAKDSDFSGTKNGTFKYIGKDDYVEIPHTIKGVNVTNYANMFEWTKVKGVKSTNKNVNNMSYMFYSLQSETLDVSELDTTNVLNMIAMFGARSIDGNDSVLTTLDLSNFYTGKVTSMGSMFIYSKVTNLDLNSFDTSNVTDMGGMFSSSHATTLDLRSFNTTKVTSMSQMFLDVKANSIDLSSFDTANVTLMTYMFGATYRGRNLIRKLDITNFDTTRVTNMSSMFRGSLLKEIDLSNFNTGNVTNMGDMFYQSDIGTLDLSSFDTANVGFMNNMFFGSQATSIDISSFRTNKVQTMSGMFNASKVKKLDLSKFATSNVVTMSEMFKDSSVEELDLTSFNTGKVTLMFDMFRESKATKINVSSFDTRNVSNMGFMFYKSKATDLDLSNFNTSKVKNMSYMFTGSSATHLDVSNFDTKNVTTMANIFEDSKATTVDLSSFTTERITDMSNMFKGSSATNIDMSGFNTKYVLNMKEMFKDSKVEVIDLSSFDMGSVNDTTGMFIGAGATTGVARSRDDADKLVNSQGKPERLKFNTLYTLATDDDFSGFYNGNFRYIGKKEYVEMPDKIKGTALTSYANLFENTSVKGVISKNRNIINMGSMFKGNTSEDLDVTMLDTTNVTDMSSLFYGTTANTLDLRNFITTRVTDISNMFSNTKVNELDLGSFDLTNVTNTTNMFKDTTAKVGYARNKEDLTKLNTSSGKPITLNFTIWGILTEQSKDDWTNESVDIRVKAESDLNGVDFVERVNEPGRNLLKGTVEGNTGEYYNGMGITRVRRTIETGYTDTYSKVSIEPLLGETYTLSFYAKSSQEGKSFVTHFYNPNTTTSGINSQGNDKTASDGHSSFTSSTEWKHYWVTYKQTPASKPKNIIAGRIMGLTELSIAGVKLEEGDTATPWSPAPEDSASTGDQKDLFTVYNNGTYIFRATDKGGNTKTVSHTVTNIDTDNPTADIKKSTTGWTSDDVTIYINAKDDLSGVKSITLPDGTITTKDTAEYKATKNGTYQFKVTDNAGNISEYSEEVTNIDRNVPRLTATIDNNKWTRDPVNIKVTSEESASGLKDIEMLSSPLTGINLMKNTLFRGNVGDKLPEGWDVGRGANGYGTELVELVNSPFKEGELAYHIKVTNDRYYLYNDSKINRVNVEEGTQITTSIYSKTNKVTTWYRFYDKDDNVINYVSQQEFEHYKGDVYYYTTNVPKGAVSYSVSRLGVGTNQRTTGEDTFSNIKVEIGDTPTPYTQSPEDAIITNNSKNYVATENGLYTFKATYNNGLSSEISANVTNIDKEAPKLTVTGNPEDWVEDDTVTLTINATDKLSGISKIILPNGTEFSGNKTTYTVNANGKYEFKVVDNVGNTSIHTEIVEYLMVPYNFYLYDKESKPVKGAVFELLRNGEAYKKATSDSKGFIDFGKIPTDGKYSLRQLSAPDGVVIDPEGIESPDVSEPVEFITYPRGETLPSTGLNQPIILVGIVATLVGLTVSVTHKKRKIDNTKGRRDN